MCGILGFFDGKNSLTRDAARRAGAAMIRTLAHRGPDDEGIWQDSVAPVLLAHRRLSILDLSPLGHQPMESATGRYVITFNGEIYNFQELQKDLEKSGAKFRGRSDTEVMLAGFEQWGLNLTLQKLDGMFAFGLWDRMDRTLHLVRDRMGKKPLYVGWAGPTVTFASELKAFRKHPLFKPAVNRDALALYLRYACVPAPFSIYKGVWQLPAGCRMVLDTRKYAEGADFRPLMEPYWHHARVVEAAKYGAPVIGDEDAVKSFEALLKDCVRERMISDVPLGALLSGGLDSSVVVAMMQQQSARPVKTYTIGFKEKGFDEAGAARAVAKHLGTEHHEMYVGPKEALDVIPRLPDIYDEPFSDESQIPTYIVSQFARKEVTVALSGDGGDELLGGYVRHVEGDRMWRTIGWMPGFVRKGAGHAIRMIGPDTWSLLNPKSPRFGERLHKGAELLLAGGFDDIYMSLASRWSQPAKLVGRAQEMPIPLTDPEWKPQGLAFAEQLMYADALSYLPNDILVKVDRASMAVGLECRAPLLDYRLFEYAWRLPLRMKIRDGKGKWLLRQVLSHYMPAELYERPKQGFSVPVGTWLTGTLRDWAADLLDESKLKQQGYLNAPLISAEWKAFLKGRTHNSYRLWTVLMFQAWLQRWK